MEKDQNVYTIEYIDVDEEGNITQDYGDTPNDMEMEESYSKLELDLSPEHGGNSNLMDKMKDNYKHSVSLTDISKDKKDLKEIFRQLNRFKYCVDKIKYKVAILHKNYMCFIRRDDSLEGFIILDHNLIQPKVLVVTIDLESLYEKLPTVHNDIVNVIDGIHKVLDVNQIKHSNNLKKLVEQGDVMSQSELIYLKKQKYANYLNQLTVLYNRVSEAEKYEIHKLQEISDKYSESSVTGMHTDIQKAHKMSKHEKELEKINIIKKDIINNINELKNIHNELTLNVDKIFFDTSVMLDAIIKNMKELETM